METKYLPIPFKNEALSFENLSIDKLFYFFERVNQHPYCQSISAHLIENEREGIVFDVSVEVPQYRKFDIRSTERILVIFDKLDKSCPEVYALRRDFPETLHQNIRNFEFPRCLCVYEQPYHELKLKWTAASFLEQIRNWLKMTALGKSHGDNQTLEPYILGYSGNIILPQKTNDNQKLAVKLIGKLGNKYNFLATEITEEASENSNGEYFVFYISCKVQLHGIIKSVPINYNDLYKLLFNLDVDLSKIFKEKIIHFYKHNDQNKLFLKPLVIIKIPIKRDLESDEVSNQIFCFYFNEIIGEMGVKLNILWSSDNGETYVQNISTNPTISNDDIPTAMLKPHIAFNSSLGSEMNNITKNINIKLLIIGVGAIGSQIFLNLARMGFGKWHLIDNDLLLPHNLARHALYNSVGYNKSEIMSIQANTMLGDKSFSNSIVDDFNSPIDIQEIDKVISETDLIVDCSASIAVAREIAAKNADRGRCVSIFLNTTGTDLVILAEDINKTIGLDALEMQYYRELTKNLELDMHLTDNNGSVRYATSCRDVSSRIPQDYVALHSAIGTNFIKRILDRNEAKIGVWQINEETLSIKHFDVAFNSVTQKSFGGWNILIDSYIENKLFEARTNKLPNETGGVLIGAYDMERKKIYIVDTVLSPKDSIESPYSYYRGIEGLEERLDEIAEKTISNLMYIGEWHSHPPKASLAMSKDDKIHYNWVREHFEKMDLPPLTIIVGEGEYRIYNNLKDTDFD